MLRIEIPTAASPESVLREIRALSRYRDPPDPIHPLERRQLGVRVNGARFSLRIQPRSPWLREYRPVLHGTVMPDGRGGAVVSGSCGYTPSSAWSGLGLAVGVPPALARGWMGIVIGVLALLAVATLIGQNRVRAREPDAAMLLLARALHHAVRSAEGAGTASASVRRAGPAGE